MVTIMKLCQCCAKEIKAGERAIEVRYGKMKVTAHPHWKVSPEIVDFFHATCDVAISDERKKPDNPAKNEE